MSPPRERGPWMRDGADGLADWIIGTIETARAEGVPNDDIIHLLQTGIDVLKENVPIEDVKKSLWEHLLEGRPK